MFPTATSAQESPVRLHPGAFLAGLLVHCCRPACARARALLSHALKLHLPGTRSARPQVPAAAAASPRPPGPGALKPRLVLQRP